VTRIAPTFRVLTLLAAAFPSLALAQTTFDKDHPASQEDAATPDLAAQASSRLLDAVSKSVTALDATGDRTSEAIADSNVTLTLVDIPDAAVHFRDLCLNGGNPLRTFTQSLTEALNLEGQVLSPTCTGAGKDSDPLKLSFRLHYEGGGSAFFNEHPLLLQPNLIFFDDTSESNDGPEPEPSEDLAAGRPSQQQQKPIPLDLRHSQISHAVMSLPPGWFVTTPPPPIHSDSPFATFDRKVTYADGKLVTDQQLTIKTDKVEVTDIPAFEKWVDSSSIEGASLTVLLGSTFYYPDSAFTGNTKSEKKAADLLQQARDEIKSKNFDKAQSLIDQAEAIDPDHELIHDDRGDLAKARGDLETALNEYQKELHAFPDVLIEMESIGFAQEALQRNDDAIATFERWIAGDPNTDFPVRDLMFLYHDMGRDDLAVWVGDQAMQTMNSNGTQSVRFLLLYGQEQERVGQIQAAAATFEKILQHTTDIQLVNEATYVLSEHGLALDRAEESMRSSLTQFDPENVDRVHHMYDSDTKQRTSLMLSSWDTLGWILYKEGKIKEAEEYIRAAWRSKQDVAIGLHLGQLLDAEDKPVEALDAFKLALATIAPQAQEKAAKDPDVIAVLAEIDRLEALGHKSTITDPAAALARLRVIDAGPAGKFHGESKCGVVLDSSGIHAIFPREDRSAEAEKMINTMKIIDGIQIPHDFFPSESHATITKEAALNCTTTCLLTLTP
jgi:tetratricopeptide (TPR) repeat protein